MNTKIMIMKRNNSKFMFKLQVVWCWEAPPLDPPRPLVVSWVASVPTEHLALVSWPHPHSPSAELQYKKQ